MKSRRTNLSVLKKINDHKLLLTFEHLGEPLLEVDPDAWVTAVLVQQPEVVLFHQVQLVTHFAQQLLSSDLSLEGRNWKDVERERSFVYENFKDDAFLTNILSVL